jgi:hypothetical protein
VVSPSAAARATSVQYVLSDVIRKTYAPGPVTFACRLNYSPVLSEWGRCHSYSSYTGDIGIYYEFEFLNYPEATWVELDRRMRQIYAGMQRGAGTLPLSQQPILRTERPAKRLGDTQTSTFTQEGKRA